MDVTISGITSSDSAFKVLLPSFSIMTSDTQWVPVEFSPVENREHCSTLYFKYEKNTNVDSIQICATDFSLVSSVDRFVDSIPTEFFLFQNYPNPFNPQTQIRYQIPRQAKIEITVYNVTGQLVRILSKGVRAAGSYILMWDGRGDNGHIVPSGMYIIQMRAGQIISNRKVLFLK